MFLTIVGYYLAYTIDTKMHRRAAQAAPAAAAAAAASASTSTAAASSGAPAALAALMTETASNLRRGVVSTVARMLPATERRSVLEQWAAEGDPTASKVKDAEKQIRTVNVSVCACVFVDGIVVG